jgi:hypothetical protein
MHTKTAFIMCCVLGIPAAGHALTFDVREDIGREATLTSPAIRSARVGNRLVGEYGDG